MRITSNACEDINRLNNLFMFRFKEDRKREGGTSLENLINGEDRYRNIKISSLVF